MVRKSIKVSSAAALAMTAFVAGADAATVDNSAALAAGSKVAIVRPERTGLPDLNVIHSTGIALGERGTLGFIGPRPVMLNLRNGQLVIDPFEIASAETVKPVETVAVSAPRGSVEDLFGSGGAMGSASGTTAAAFRGAPAPAFRGSYSPPSFRGTPPSAGRGASPLGPVTMPPGAPGSKFVPPAVASVPKFGAPASPQMIPNSPPSMPTANTNAPAQSGGSSTGGSSSGGPVTDNIHNDDTIDGGSPGSPLVLAGNVNGPGSYTGTVAFTGTFSPGNSPAAITGDHMIFDGTLIIELGGTSRNDPVEYDSITLTGTAELGGTLEVQLIDWPEGSEVFAPQIGDTFDILRADIFTGEFANILFPTLDGAHFEWQIVFVDDHYDFRLSVVADDQVVARAVLAQAPEPATLALVGAGLALFGIGRRRRSA